MNQVNIIEHAPKVFVVGISTPVVNGVEAYLNYRQEQWNRVPRGGPFLPSEAIIEMAGRVCYQSWNNPAHKSTQEYIATSILENKHGSVLEHLWINFLCADMPRSTQLELVRHGDGTAYSFESTRFTDKHQRFVMPPAIRAEDDARGIFVDTVNYVAQRYEWLTTGLKDGILSDELETTLRRKRVKEASRSILTNSLGSDGMFSVNMRAIRHIIQMRTDDHADLSIREFAYAVYEAALPFVPDILQDAVITEGGYGIPVVKFKAEKV